MVGLLPFALMSFAVASVAIPRIATSTGQCWRFLLLVKHGAHRSPTSRRRKSISNNSGMGDNRCHSGRDMTMEMGATMRFAVILSLFVISFPTAGITQETPHLAFVSEYIRELGANENARELSAKDSKKLSCTIPWYVWPQPFYLVQSRASITGP